MSEWKINSTTVFQSRFDARANEHMNNYIESVNNNPLEKVCDIKFQADQTNACSYWSAMVVVCERSGAADLRRVNPT